MATNLKRNINDELIVKDDNEEWIGPMPSEATQVKKPKVLDFEAVYLNNLPNSEFYEQSYMHRDTVTHIVTAKSTFIITASCDGHVKFWKKRLTGIEFVKHFRAHMGNIQDVTISDNGEFYATISNDKSLKVFDVINFDMINMMKLDYVPKCTSFCFTTGDHMAHIAVSDQDSSSIYVYDSRSGSSQSLKVMDKLHSSPLSTLKYNPVYECLVSVDDSGMLECWSGPKHDYEFPKKLSWTFKTDTDLYEFAKCKCRPIGLSFSVDGHKMAVTATDNKVRIFNFDTGKLSKVIDESVHKMSDEQKAQMKQQLSNMEISRRSAVESDMQKNPDARHGSIVFDESGNFVIYPTMHGIKVINLVTNKCARTFGRLENCRFLNLALFQGSVVDKSKDTTAPTLETEGSEMCKISSLHDTTLFCTAFKRNRFFMFTRRKPLDHKGTDNERDVFNEKPSKAELAAATHELNVAHVSHGAVIFTSMGDIHLKLHPDICPKTVENFCEHSRNGYYNGHIFHRVIKGFMIQTGDPLGTGSGGESIWGGEFADEFDLKLRHDRPYSLSMANAGPNTNGSQFFLTLAPTPWLDDKHTVFGYVTRGMDIVQSIGSVKVDSENDKPYDDIKIINIKIA